MSKRKQIIISLILIIVVGVGLTLFFTNNSDILLQRDAERFGLEMGDNRIDLMIEDSPKNINELSKIVPVICYDARYNRQCEGENITRCYSWYDIYNKVKLYEVQNEEY